jgi:NAD(P)-dependent dehydrogenase (short-subunit alcohol dehydrogenase family)
MNIVITGNSAGIGKMLTDRLVSNGHVVYGLSRSSEYKCDVTNYEQVEDWARYFLDADINIDALITCAGTQGEVGKTSKTDAEAWAETISVNLNGTYNAIRAFYPIMDKSHRAKIVCLAGGGSANGRPYFSAYAAAKTAVVRLVESISLEEQNLDINAVAPGAIKTNIIDGALKAGPSVIGESEYNKALKQSTQGDDPERMLNLIEWLLSEKSDGISGRFISAIWDDWEKLDKSTMPDEIYKLRRNVL